MKPIIHTEDYYGHLLEVTINNVTGKLDFIPDEVKEVIFSRLTDGEMENQLSEEETGGFSGSWRIIELNHELLCRVGMWKYNHNHNESLSEELFIQYFGSNYGKHFYSKWVHTYKFDFMNMITYFGRDTESGQKFCDMVMKQVKKYEKRDR